MVQILLPHDSDWWQGCHPTSQENSGRNDRRKHFWRSPQRYIWQRMNRRVKRIDLGEVDLWAENVAQLVVWTCQRSRMRPLICWMLLPSVLAWKEWIHWWNISEHAIKEVGVGDDHEFVLESLHYAICFENGFEFESHHTFAPSRQYTRNW